MTFRRCRRHHCMMSLAALGWVLATLLPSTATAFDDVLFPITCGSKGYFTEKTTNNQQPQGTTVPYTLVKSGTECFEQIGLNGDLTLDSRASADDCANAVTENSQCTGVRFEWNSISGRCTCFPAGTVCAEHADWVVTMYDLSANCAAGIGSRPGSALMNTKLGREYPYLGPVSCAVDFHANFLFVKQGSGACLAIASQLKAFDSVIFEHIKCVSYEGRTYFSFYTVTDDGLPDINGAAWCNAALPVLKQWVDSVPGKWILGEPNQSCAEVCAAQTEFSRCDLNVLTTFGSGDVPTPDWTDRCAGKGDGNARLHPSLRVSDSKCFTNGADDDAQATCENKDPDFRRFCPCSFAYGTSNVASKWTRIAHCETSSAYGTGRRNFDADKIMRMAKGATQVRICTRGSDDDCVESYPGTYPIKMLREGKAVSHNNGASQSIDAIKQVWSGPDARLAALTSSCTAGHKGNAGDSNIMFESSKEGSYFYHACGNTDGLVISLHDGGYCAWDYDAGIDNLDIFINVPGPTTCTDLSCDIASYDDVDGLINNPHFAKAKNAHFVDGTATLHVEDGKGFWWGKQRAATNLSNGKTAWRCAPDDSLHLVPPINAVSLSITYSGAYDSPSRSTGQMSVSDGSGLFSFRDAHASASTGQSLRVPYYNLIYRYAQNNEVDRTDILTLTSSAVANGIEIKMCGSIGDDGLERPYSKRYIKSIIWNVRPATTNIATTTTTTTPTTTTTNTTTSSATTTTTTFTSTPASSSTTTVDSDEQGSKTNAGVDPEGAGDTDDGEGESAIVEDPPNASNSTGIIIAAILVPLLLIVSIAGGVLCKQREPEQGQQRAPRPNGNAAARDDGVRQLNPAYNQAYKNGAGGGGDVDDNNDAHYAQVDEEDAQYGGDAAHYDGVAGNGLLTGGDAVYVEPNPGQPAIYDGDASTYAGLDADRNTYASSA